MDNERGPWLFVTGGSPQPLSDFEKLCDAIGFGPTMPIRDNRDLVDKAEAEIARRDLTNQYVAELVRLLGPQVFADELTLEGAYTYGNRAILSFDREHRAVFTATGPALFVLITAPPEARARAMLEVLTR